MIPKSIIENVLESNGTKYVPVKVLRNSLNKNELEKFSDWFFGKPVVIGVDSECGIPFKDIQLFFNNQAV
jgi:glutaredoxin-related protein